ncbi:MAG: L-2-amino-thiazoline-4-carboxylic acid hydrolase [Spirochaetales bacterium]|nr:L-2-amino-thiazoline-4-carboxylic acid hydrolase [Spirochaetales bacterium]
MFLFPDSPCNRQAFKNVEEERTIENLVKNQQRTNKEGTTRLNTMEIIEQTRERYQFRMTRCLFFEFFNYLKIPELTSIMCSIHNAIFNTYLPDEYFFHRGGKNKTFTSGADECTFIVEKRKY